MLTPANQSKLALIRADFANSLAIIYNPQGIVGIVDGIMLNKYMKQRRLFKQTF